jgi:hypothetical protein
VYGWIWNKVPNGREDVYLPFEISVLGGLNFVSLWMWNKVPNNNEKKRREEKRREKKRNL